MRYVVTELEGFGNADPRSSHANPGLSCHVIDTAWNRRLIATYRTEDLPVQARHEGKRIRVRRMASDHAARLNGCR